MERDLEEAEKYLNQALKILEASEQDKVYRVLETLIELYEYKALTQQYYVNKKWDLSRKLLIILENSFPNDYSYVNKIK